MTDTTLLVVDDDAKIRRLLATLFESEGFAVRCVPDGAAALDVVKHHQIDLITLDLNLGREDGLDIARDIRKFSQVPIIMVTGKDDMIDRVVGLEIGADDYITKPFHVREVLARVRTVLRRTQTAKLAVDERGDILRFDGLTVVPERMEISDRTGSPLNLTSGDFKLLTVFLENPGRVLSRDRLMDLVGGLEWSPLDRTIDNQVARLRKKLERDTTAPKIIKSVRGVGYVFAAEIEQD